MTMTPILDRSGNTLYETKGGPKALSGQDDLNLGSAVLQGEDLEGFVTYGTNFRNADLRTVDLYWSIIGDSDFSYADLSHADLRGSFHNCLFLGANLTGANVGRDNLGGPTRLLSCDFSGAELDGANFEGAVCDRATRFPEGFNPTARGAAFDDQSDGPEPTCSAQDDQDSR
jgi:uncharacterized protein YjbI with pentapeptide repeats